MKLNRVETTTGKLNQADKELMIEKLLELINANEVIRWSAERISEPDCIPVLVFKMELVDAERLREMQLRRDMDGVQRRKKVNEDIRNGDGLRNL